MQKSGVNNISQVNSGKLGVTFYQAAVAGLLSVTCLWKKKIVL